MREVTRGEEKLSLGEKKIRGARRIGDDMVVVCNVRTICSP